jgi:TPR repeat protein
MKNHLVYLFAGFFLTATFSVVANEGPASGSSAPDSADKVAVAIQYLTGQGVTKNESKGFEILEEAAATGDADALCGLGACYALGQGVPRDDAKARDLFKRATEAGSTAGASNLGIFLVRGRGGEADVARGIFLLKKAAAAGHLSSAMLLGEIYAEGAHAGGKPDYQKAYDILVGPATEGDPAAQNFIGVILKDGRLGPDRVPEARVWLEKAAFQGNGKACFNLARLWDPNSPDKMARIEGMRWLLLGSELQEPLSSRMVQDLQPMFTEEDFAVAMGLAKVTWQQVLRRQVSDSFGRPSIPEFTSPPPDPATAGD